MNQNIITQVEKTPSVLERINKKKIIYLCICCELLPCFGTPSYAQALKYARLNNCTISEYPIGAYIDSRY